MEPASPPRRRVPEHHPASSARAGIVQGRWRRRPAGEPPPLPRRLGRTGWWWLGLGTIAIIASIVLAGGRSSLPFHRGRPLVAEPLPSVDQRVLEGLAGLRTPALTGAMVVVAALSSQWVIAALGWATILVLLAARRFRHLLVFFGVALLIHTIANNLAYGTLEQVSTLRPAELAVLGPTGKSAYPVLPLAMLTGRLVSMLYCLVPRAGDDSRARRWSPPLLRWSPWPASGPARLERSSTSGSRRGQVPHAINKDSLVPVT
jgi:hypothetical protein